MSYNQMLYLGMLAEAKLQKLIRGTCKPTIKMREMKITLNA